MLHALLPIDVSRGYAPMHRVLCRGTAAISQFTSIQTEITP